MRIYICSEQEKEKFIGIAKEIYKEQAEITKDLNEYVDRVIAIEPISIDNPEIKQAKLLNKPVIFVTENFVPKNLYDTVLAKVKKEISGEGKNE